MTKRFLIAVFAVVLMAPPAATFAASTATAQGRSAPVPTVPTAQPPAPTLPVPPRPSAQAGTGSLPRSNNIQLDVAITDTASGQTEPKHIRILLRSGGFGSIRTVGSVATPRAVSGIILAQGEAPPALQETGYSPVELALDASVTAVGSDLVEAVVTFTYAAPPQPAGPLASVRGEPTKVDERMTVLLHSGRPMLVSRSADPVTNRTVTVELTATIREP